MLGSGQSKTSFLGAELFYTSQRSPLAVFLKTMFSKLWTWEEKPNGEAPAHTLDQLIEEGGFSFVDLCPWLKTEGKDLSAAVSILHQYTGVTKPFVMLAISEKPSVAAASNFQNASGYSKSKCFGDRVGILHLVYCGKWCSIQIPCFHPGRARYMKERHLFDTIIEITLCILFLAVQTVLDTQLFMSAELQTTCSLFIKGRVEGILRSKAIDTLLAQAKRELQDSEAKRLINFQKTIPTRSGYTMLPLRQVRLWYALRYPGLVKAPIKKQDRSIFSDIAVGAAYSSQ
jgi:hypothetical protein